ncbi:serine proteinase stubble isoform X1 [Neodiprion pinetum]|uniref:serine proteinase stubble isoform X1 n=1 Tax=Neodiprion pinetum TaxID=441929 RepID=UPI001EDF37B0|nr:serine proteinase stubble isoform X1 [Neodiprion pinetum]
MTEITKFRATLLLLCNVVVLTIGSPVFMPQFLPGGAGRHIRHLPCVSRRSGEQGVCMFAFTCAKANGTHLGTCIDRFYFGSCCKINKEPEIFPQDNTIDDSSINSYLTNHESIDNNNIPEYSPKPSQTATRITEAPVTTTQTPVITEKPVKIADKLPVATTHAPVSEPVKFTSRPTNKYTRKPVPDSTTESVSLSTFQTVENSPTKRPTTKYPQKITTVAPATTHSKPRPSSNRPISSVKPNQKPTTSNSTKIGTNTTIKPSVYKPQNGGLTPIDTRTTTVKPILTTTQRSTVSATRFPPRNATTTTTTTRPTRPTPVRRPTSTTTKRPASTPAKRVTTTSTTPKTPVTKRPVASGVSVTVASRPPTVLGIKNVTATVPATVGIPVGGQKPTTPGKRPTVAVQGRPTAATTIGVNKRPTTPSTKPASSTVSSTVGGGSSKPATTSPKPPSTRPRPKPTTQIPEFPTTKAPVQKPAPTIVTTTSTTTTTTTTTKRPIASSSRPRPTLTTVAPSDTAGIFSLINDVIFSEDTTNQVLDLNTNKVETTSYSPGLVTWMSNSDDTTTRSPVIPTAVTELEEPTNTEWTPITTPDGWILIQSPAPSDPPEIEDKPTTRPTPKPMTSSPVTDKPTTVPTSTTQRSPTRPSLPTVATTPSTTDNYVPTVELNMSDYKQVCGRRFFPESRIVGGAKSSFGKWPWQISLRQWRTSTYLHKCGAALLNENWAITAAHCVENVAPSDLLLRLGEHDLESEDEPYGFQERRVQIVASHPQFDPRTFEYDLALLRFYEPLLPFQPNTVPICLPDDDANYVGLMAHVTGWGRLYEGIDGPLPSVLQEVSVPVINNTVCEGMYRSAGYIEHIPKIFICAGWRKGGFDSCEGDSGGPLVIQRPRDKRWILAGVISWGIGCAEPNQPGVYTRISEFREWINQILQF